jgi:hypothetical protein
MTNIDINYVKGILPSHYRVTSGKKENSIHCVSEFGLKTPDGKEDEEKWQTVMRCLRGNFGTRFLEVFHNVCYMHTDFTIYLKDWQ